MKISRILSILSAAIVLGLSGLLGAASANAATGCAVNYLCFYDTYGYKTFSVNGSTAYNSQALYGVQQPMNRSINNTLGKFCTYDRGMRVTNILAAQTQGFVANPNVAYVRLC